MIARRGRKLQALHHGTGIHRRHGSYSTRFVISSSPTTYMKYDVTIFPSVFTPIASPLQLDESSVCCCFHLYIPLEAILGHVAIYNTFSLGQLVGRLYRKFRCGTRTSFATKIACVSLGTPSVIPAHSSTYVMEQTFAEHIPVDMLERWKFLPKTRRPTERATRWPLFPVQEAGNHLYIQIRLTRPKQTTQIVSSTIRIAVVQH